MPNQNPEGLFKFERKNYPDFHTPDSGPDKTPYCCSFHWFRLPDDRIVGLDVVRSDDLKQLCLRTYLINSDGSIKGMVFERPLDDWLPFAVKERPPLNGPTPSLGRGVNWVAGYVKTEGLEINSVSFDLNIVPESTEHDFGMWTLALSEMTAADFTKVHTTGWVEIDGQRFDVNNYGPVSFHYGDKLLPAYGYCATVFSPLKKSAPEILLASFTGAALRIGGKLFKNDSLTYAYGYNGTPKRLYSIGSYYEDNKISVGVKRYILLTEVNKFSDDFLDVETVTASAKATLYLYNPGFLWWRLICPGIKEYNVIELGQVILDYRGEYYFKTLL